MKKENIIYVALLIMSLGVQDVRAQVVAHSGDVSISDTVHVALPTGETETDRANVQAAFDAVQPGDVVRFAPGTYLLGAGARLTVPDVTVLGHPGGTVLRGCEPERFDLPDGFGMEEVGAIAMGCTGLYVLAENQTIRGLTFDHTWHGLFIGAAPWLGPPGESGTPASGLGGHLIEKNVFRNVPNGIRVVGPSARVTVIRDNEVVNAYHAFQSNGAPVHVIENRITVPEPETVPAAYYPESGVILSPDADGAGCMGSRVEGNDVSGTIHGIQVLAGAWGRCSEHEIRNNVIRVRQVRLPSGYPSHHHRFYFGEGAEGSAVAGTAIRLYGAMEDGAAPEGGSTATIAGVVVQDNRVLGGAGLGIQLVNASGNRIEGNHVSDIRARSPFPGLTWGDRPQCWREANGSGIWLSPASNENEIIGNVFEDVASHAVVLEGDGNVVELRSEGDGVRGLGTGNVVRRQTPEIGTAAQAEDFLGFLDALGIERAVLAENTDGSFRMTHFAEEQQ
jgi:parallel beta-helix repeat protein